MQATFLQVIRQLLNARLVPHGRVPVVLARKAGERILAMLAMHPEQVLGAGVVRLHVVVAQGPGWRYSVWVLNLAEVPGQ